MGGNLNLSLDTWATTTVNNSFPLTFTIVNITILIATIATNIWAIHIIHKKETSRINRFRFKSLRKKPETFQVDNVGLLDEHTDYASCNVCPISLVHHQVKYFKSEKSTKLESRSIWMCIPVVFLLNALHTWNRMVAPFLFLTTLISSTSHWSPLLTALSPHIFIFTLISGYP